MHTNRLYNVLVKCTHKHRNFKTMLFERKMKKKNSHMRTNSFPNAVQSLEYGSELEPCKRRRRGRNSIIKNLLRLTKWMRQNNYSWMHLFVIDFEMKFSLLFPFLWCKYKMNDILIEDRCRMGTGNGGDDHSILFKHTWTEKVWKILSSNCRIVNGQNAIQYFLHPE